jgi:hypothetical protein
MYMTLYVVEKLGFISNVCLFDWWLVADADLLLVRGWFVLRQKYCPDEHR